MPNTTTSWHSLKPAARHRDRQEVCNAAAPGCALCCPADSDPRRSVSGGPGGPGTGTHVLSHTPAGQHRKTRLLPRVLPPQQQQHPQAAGGWTGREPAVFAASRGSRCSPGQACQLLLSVRPPVCRTWRSRGHTHTHVPTWGALCSRRGWQSGCTWHPAHPDLLRAPAHTCMNMRAHAHTDTRVQLRTHTHTHIICAHTWMDIHIHAWMHINVYSCTSVHTRAHACAAPQPTPSPLCSSFPAHVRTCAILHHSSTGHQHPTHGHAPPETPQGCSAGPQDQILPPPACLCQLVAMCGAAAAEYTAPAIRLAACQGRGLLRRPPATAQRDAGVKAGRERGFPSPCSHLPAPCLLCQGLAQPQLCPGYHLHMPL